LPLPSCSATIEQVPIFLTVTVVPETVQISDVPTPMISNATTKPDVEVADRLAGVSP
jgi:hypothetical protein